ncbi:MAG: phosphoribosyltransferase family protein [Elusimicrobiales bacterium]|nr:phosphoribosyltransferase family protein [Elusimicrobiales bacterium]
MTQLFEDRKDATLRLVKLMAAKDLKLKNPIVIGIPRGGVAVAYYIAKSLQAPMDILVSKKLAAPSNPEFGFGAVTLDKVAVVNNALAGELALSREDTGRAIDMTYDGVLRRAELYRQGRPFPGIAGRDVILADDGLATGYTMLAAVRWVKSKAPASITVAVPVAHESALKMVRRETDHVFTAQVDAAPMFSVGSFYREFGQLEDDDVLRYIEKSRFNTN